MPYKNKEDRNSKARIKAKEARKEWFSGKVCKECEINEDLELDHIDPTTKITNSVWHWSLKRRLDELAKCQALCKSCHLEKTKRERQAKYRHGTYSNWRNKGCRCESCVQAQRNYKKEYRQRTGIR